MNHPLEFQPVGDLAEDEIPDLRMGFGTSNVKSGTSTSNRHTHEFGPISKEWYRKRDSEDIFYAMLLCACGATKEVVAEDRRAPYPQASLQQFALAKLETNSAKDDTNTP